MAKIKKEDAVPAGTLSQREIKHVATLARLEISESEETKFTEQLGSVLDYFDKLDSAETGDSKPIEQINNMENIVIEDTIREKYDRNEMLANAPEKEDGFIKVKAVFENDESK